jgi:hypothetical protein
MLLTSMLAAALVASLALWSSPAGAAQRPFAITFEQSAIKMGALSGLPLDQVSTGATLEGTMDDSGRIRVPRDKFKLPVVNLGSALERVAGIDVPIRIEAFMGIERDATGTYDRSTGELQLKTEAGVWVSVNVQQVLSALEGLGVNLGNLGGLPINLGSLGNLTCGFSPMPVTFATESTSPESDGRFTQGLEGPGSIVARWSQLGPLSGRGSIPIFGTLALPATVICRALPPLVESALTSAVGGETPGLGDVDLGFIFDNLDDLNLGPSSLALTSNPQAPRKARLGTTIERVSTGSAPGGPTAFRVTARNVGESAASEARVCARAPRQAVRGLRCARMGVIASGKSKRANFRLMVRVKAPRSTYRVSFRSMAAGGVSSVRFARLSRGKR